MRVVAWRYTPYGSCGAEAESASRAGFTFSVVEHDAFVSAPRPADVILNVGGWPVTTDIIERTRCRYVVGYGVGLDWIDVEAATERGVQLITMPFANAPDVALHALTLILASIRRVRRFDQLIRAGGFDWQGIGPLHRPEHLKLGLLAFGTIARQVGKLAAAVGFTCVAYDPHVSEQTMRNHGVEPAPSLEDLLRASHVLSVHVPAMPTTRYLLDARGVSLLPRGAVVVITSRGEVYDPDALAQALHDGHVAAAGIDVFDPEPPPANHPLRTAPSTLLTPHVAGTSEEAIADLHRTAAEVLEDIAEGRPPRGAVNHVAP